MMITMSLEYKIVDNSFTTYERFQMGYNNSSNYNKLKTKVIIQFILCRKDFNSIFIPNFVEMKGF